MKKHLLMLALSSFSAAMMAQTDGLPAGLRESEMKGAMYVQNRPAPTANGDNYDVKYERLQLNIDPAIREISGRITTYFTIRQTTSSLQFDASDSLIIDGAKWHGQSLTVSRPAGMADVIQVDLPSPLSTGVFDSLSFTYHGVPPSQGGFGSFIRGEHNGVPVIWTLSEPYGAKDWWICKQTLNDKIDSLDVMVTTPDIYRVAGNGLLAATTTSGSNKTYHWKHRYPIAAYLVATAVTNYAVYNETAHFVSGATMPMVNYVYPEDLAVAQSGTAQVADFIRLFDSLFVPYPFLNEKYGQAQFGWGGGMEHQTMSFVVSFNYDLLAHELAHQWFGDMVTCGSWSDLWLNEGFATYCTALTYERLPNQYQWWGVFKRLTSDNIMSVPDGSVQVSDTTNISRLFDGRLTYNKGAYLLHQLRWVCGDAAFFQGVRNYLNDPDVKYAFAKTPKFKAHLEQTSGKDLTEFFNDCYYGEGYPIYQVTWTQDANNTVTLTLGQTQSHPSVSFFELPVPVRFRNATQDTTVVLDHQSSGQVFTINLPFTADSLDFNPDLWLLAKVDAQSSTFAPADRFAGVNISPNPASNEINIAFSEVLNQTVYFTLYDLMGRQVKQVVLNTPQSRIDVSTLPKAAYTWQARTDKGRLDTGKLLLF